MRRQKCRTISDVPVVRALVFVIFGGDTVVPEYLNTTYDHSILQALRATLQVCELTYRRLLYSHFCVQETDTYETQRRPISFEATPMSPNSRQGRFHK